MENGRPFAEHLLCLRHFPCFTGPSQQANIWHGITVRPQNDRQLKFWEVLATQGWGGGVDPSPKAQPLHTPLQLQDEVSLFPLGCRGGDSSGPCLPSPPVSYSQAAHWV